MTFRFAGAAARAAAAALCILAFSLPAFGVTKTWTNNNGSGDGRWLTAANWSPSGVPTSADAVEIGVTDMSSNYCTIDGAAVALSLTLGNAFTNNPTLEIKSGATLTIDTASTTADDTTLYLNNGNVSGNGSLAASGNINFSGGTIGGSGGLTVGATGTLNFQGIAGSCYLSRNTTNNGAITFATTTAFYYLFTSAIVTNNNLINFTADEDLWTSGPGPFRIDNQSGGIVKKSAGAGSSSIKSIVNNATGGIVKAETGTLSLDGGGTSTGNFDAAAATTLAITSATYTIDSGATVTGAGKLAVSSIVNIPTGADITIPNLQLVNGSAKIDGAGTMRISSALDWDGGYMTGGGLSILQGTAAMTVDCSTNYCYLDNRQFNLGTGSTSLYTAAGSFSMYFYNGASLNVNSGATFSIQTDQDFNNGGGAASSIVNAGTLQKTSGSAATVFSVPLTSSGALSVTSGDLQFPQGATINGGTITIASTSNIDATGGTFNFAAAATFPNIGAFRALGGLVRVPTGITQVIPKFTLAGATVDGAGTLQLSGTATWSGGTMGGVSAQGGTTEVLAAATLNIMASSGYAYLDYDRQLVNNGTVNYNPTTYSLYLYNSADVVNNSIFEMQNDTAINTGGTAPYTFTNNGTFNKSGGTNVAGANIYPTFNNGSAGTVNVTSGRLNLAGSGTSSGIFSIGSGSFIQITTNTYSFGGTPSVTGLGILRVSGGNLVVPTSVTLGVPQFQFDSGYVSGAGLLQITSSGTWTGGTMGHPTYPGGTTEVAGGATLNLTGTGSYMYVDQGRTLLNHNTINYTAASTGLWLYNGSTLANAGPFNYDSDIGIGMGGSASTIANTGTIQKTTGLGAPVIGVPLNNNNLVKADTGTLLLSQNGTHTGGSFEGNGGGAVGFSGGTHTLDAISSLGGTGTILVSGATVTHAGTYNPAKLTITGGTLTLNGNGTADMLTMSNGTLNGSGTLTLLSTSTWSGGTMSGSGATIVDSGQVLTINAATTYCYLDTRTLTNNGTITYSAGANYFQVYNNATLNNPGTINITTDQILNGASNGTINNSGTLEKTGGSGTSAISTIVNNTGTVNAASGTLALNGGGAHTGNFTTSATLAFGLGTHTLSAPGTISGAGTLAFTGANATAGIPYTVGTLKITAGVATLNGNGSAGTLDMSNGTLTGTGTFTATNGGTWTGGTMSGTGQTIIPATQTLSITGATNYNYLDGRTLTNNGIINYTAGTYYLYIYTSGVLTNNGTFNIQSDQAITGTSGGVFNNAGTLTKSVTTGTTAIGLPTFNNTGAVTVSTGTLAITSGGTHTGTWTVTSPATLAFNSGAHTATAGSFGGTGTLAFGGATFTVGVPLAVGALNVTAGAVALNAASSADAFTLTGGTIGGNAGLTLNNGGTWTGGVMSGTGGTIVPAGKTLAINPVSIAYLDTRQLNNNGIITYTPPGTGYLQIQNNGTLNNAGSFTINNGPYLWASNIGTINNTGTLTKSGGAQMDVAAVVHNSGQITVTAGTLALQGGGTHANGVFTATSPGAIQFSGGTHTLSGTGSLGGTGTYLISNGVVVVGVPYTLAALNLSASGTATFNTNGTIGVLSFTAGTLNGSGTVTLTDSGTWSGGTMGGTGTTILSTGKTYTLGGTNYPAIDGRTVTNNGTLNYVATTWYFYLTNSGVLNNAGTLAIQTDLLITTSGVGTINNSGTISRTTGTANTTELYPILNNNGTILVTQGALALRGNGTHTGTFTATSPGAITFGGGTQTASAASSLGGNGTFRFTGGSLTVDGAWNIADLEISGGTAAFNTNGSIPSLDLSGGVLSGNGNFTITGDSTWNGGSMDGSGTTVVDIGVVLFMPGNNYTTLSRNLQNLGTINYSSPANYLQIDSSTLTNDGTFDMQNDAILYAYGTGPAWQNNGTLKKTSGNATIQFYPPVTNTGTVQIGSGTVQFLNTYTQTAGTTELLNNATLQNGTLNIDGGSLIGNGTITGNVTSDAIVAPGNSAGKLTITGNYVQTATGDLNIELGGTAAGTGYDQLAVGGSVTLDGDLNVSTINAFFPASGNNFQVLTFGSRPGSTDFANKNGLNLGSGTNLIPAYSATDLQLTTNTVQTDLQISMTAAPATVGNGGAITYNVTVFNGGGSNASGVAVTGTLPANVAFVSSSPAICTGAPNLVCTVGNLADQASALVTITVNATGAGAAAFTASVTGSQFDPNGANNSVNASSTITASADLSVTVTSSPASVAAGEPVDYVIAVKNNGTDTANSVILTVAPSAELTFNSANGVCTGGFPCALGNIANGVTVTITASYTVSPGATANQQLQASAAASSPADPAAANNTGTATTTISQTADVSVVKTGPTSVAPTSGSTVTYTIVVGNNGPSIATNVTVDDPTPAGLTVNSITGDCAAFPCTIPSVAVGATKTTQITYNISGAIGTTVTNTATITSPNLNAANDSSSVITTIGSCPATTITAPPTVNGNSTGNAASVTTVSGATYAWSIGNGTIAAGQGTSAITFNAGASGFVSLSVTVSAGSCVSNPSANVPINSADVAVTKTGPANVSPLNTSQITYTITVTNNGPSPATGVNLSDPTPAGLTPLSMSGSCLSFPCALGTMPVGQTHTVNVTYGFNGGAQQFVTNTASVTSTTPDHIPSNNSASASTTIAACPAIVITGPGVLEPNAAGTASATVITGADYTWSIANGTITAGQGTETVAFTAGATGTTTLSVIVSAGQCSGSDSHAVDINNNQADVAIGKLGPSHVASGEEFTYTLTISNNGPANAEGVTVSDELPAGVTFVAVSSLGCIGGSTVACNIGTLPAGATQLITITVAAPAGPATLTNTASIATSNADPIGFNNTSSVTTTVNPPLDTCVDRGTATPVSPSGVTVGSPVTFTWNGAGGAAGYVVHYRVNGGAQQEAGSTTGATSLIAPIEPGLITWTVDALFANCPSTRSAEATFTVQLPAACEGVAVLTAPANGSSSANATVDFNWSNVSGSTGYRVWLQTGSSAAEVIGSTLTNSLTKTIATGTHTWWVETLFSGCPSRESGHNTFTILPAQNCEERGRPALLAPAAGANTSSPNVAFSWTAVTGAVEYELWLAPSAGVPTLISATTLTSATAEVAPGQLEWFVRAIFNGCPATESDHRAFTYEPPPNCTANERPVLNAPAEGERLASPLSFDWNDVPGAIAYELFVAHGDNEPSLVSMTAVSQAGGIERQLGAGRWFVRARFAAGCAPLDSSESRFVVVPQAAACSELDAPVLSVPGQISSGANARVQWSFVPGATNYILETSDNPAFPAGATAVSDMGATRQYVFSLENNGAEVLEHYLRVRAVDTRCAPAGNGPYSDTAIVYVLPEVGTEASALIGDSTDVEYSLPLGPELAGETFTATPTTEWITVTPTSCTVPAGGMTLTVVAHTAGLPPGTNIGGVTITTGIASRVSSTGFTVTTPFSVNLVSPVAPTPKSTPPPDALVIPAVANADGIGSHFQSDVRVSNTSAQVMKYQLTFIPSGEAGISAGRQTTFSIEPGRTVALDDILKSWFGTGSSNAVGSLEVRPLTEVAKSTSSAPLGALANLVTFASSRTFNVTPNGTFGQHIPAIPFANFIDKSKILSLQQIAQSQQYRTNLGLVEGSGEPANLLVKVFSKTGSQLTEFPVNLTGGQHTQLNGFLATHGISSLDDGRVEVSVIGGSGKVTAYASVLDNNTADPLLVSPVTLDEAGNTRWVVPGVADLSNGAANWQTDMRVFNAGTTPEELTLAFHSMNGGEPKTTTMTLQPGEVRQLDKILTNTFGVSQNGGAVHILTADSARLIATARTYNQTTQGTYGQFISAVTPAEAVGIGSRPLQLLQVEESSRYRSNIGLAEVSGKPVTLEVTVVPPDAKFTASTQVTLAANEFRQITSMLAALGLGETYNARVTVRAVSGEGRATAYASVIDAKTNDPTYVPAQ